MSDEWVEEIESKPLSTETDIALIKQMAALAAENAEFKKRMENWRKTVRGGSGGGSGCCASWASWYVKKREAENHGDVGGSRLRAIATHDEVDGWLIELTVGDMQDFKEKMALRYHYVFQYPEHWIRKKLGLRRTSVALLLGLAKTNLQKSLCKKKYWEYNSD